MSKTDPRDIERINPENTQVSTSVNDVPVKGEGDDGAGTSIQGAVLKTLDEATQRKPKPTSTTKKSA